MQTTYREAIRDAMSEEMRTNNEVFLMGEEVAEYKGAYKCSQGMLEEFGSSRVIDSPITELGFTGLCVGAAMKGMRPVVEYMSWSFALLATDQIINNAAKTYYMSGGKVKCPIVFRGINGVAPMVAAQHSQCFANLYANTPGLKVVAPSTPADAKGLLKASIRDNAPVIFLESERLYGTSEEVPEGDDFVLPIGKAKVVQQGTDITVIGYSAAMVAIKNAAKQLEKEGVSVEVIDLRTIKPLDIETILNSVRKTHRALVVEEGYAFAGIGAEIMAQISDHAFDELDAPVKRLSTDDVPVPYAKNMEDAILPNTQKVIDAVKEVCC